MATLAFGQSNGIVVDRPNVYEDEALRQMLQNAAEPSPVGSKDITVTDGQSAPTCIDLCSLGKSSSNI
jgi:hypothetical protein